MTPLDLVGLKRLMDLTTGSPEVVIGLIDGPVASNHPDLLERHIQELPAALPGRCSRMHGAACTHGTFVAGMLVARRDSAAPAVCPNCTLLIRPIFSEGPTATPTMLAAAPEELAAAVRESIDAGARVLNLSVTVPRLSSPGAAALNQALAYAVQRGVLVVAAAGNQGTMGSSGFASHPWVIPVMACDLQGRPIAASNLGASLARQGVSAPGENITSLGPSGDPLTLSGSSFAAPFVTGTIALLWSAARGVTAAAIKYAITRANRTARNQLVPPLLDAWAAYRMLVAAGSAR